MQDDGDGVRYIVVALVAFATFRFRAARVFPDNGLSVYGFCRKFVSRSNTLWSSAVLPAYPETHNSFTSGRS